MIRKNAEYFKHNPNLILNTLWISCFSFQDKLSNKLIHTPAYCSLRTASCEDEDIFCIFKNHDYSMRKQRINGACIFFKKKVDTQDMHDLSC